MMLTRRKKHPRVKILGSLYSFRREHKDDSVIREIKIAMDNMPIQRHCSSGEVTLVENFGVRKP